MQPKSWSAAWFSMKSCASVSSACCRCCKLHAALPGTHNDKVVDLGLSRRSRTERSHGSEPCDRLLGRHVKDLPLDPVLAVRVVRSVIVVVVAAVVVVVVCSSQVLAEDRNVRYRQEAEPNPVAQAHALSFSASSCRPEISRQELKVET